MSQADIILSPRDGLFCKDGRGWFTSSTGRGHSLEWPYPSTLLGALRSLWGRTREDREGRRFQADDWPQRTADLRLGPTLPLRRSWGERWSAAHRIWPAPADARVVEAGAIERLDPRPPTLTTLGRDDDPARERLWTAPGSRHKSTPGPRWWSEAWFLAWLEGASSVPLDGSLELPRRIQTHVSIDPKTGAALDQNLYSHDLVETFTRDREWAIGCRVLADDLEHLPLATVGSDRRLASVEGGAGLFEPPRSLLEAFAQGIPGLRLFVVTPAAFERGWLPDGLHARGDHYQGWLPALDVEVVLRAAFVNRALAISGWDMARGRPKPSTRAVPPGSVYAFTRADGQPFSVDQARALWLTSIGQRKDEGLGVVVPGVWMPHPRTRS